MDSVACEIDIKGVKNGGDVKKKSRTKGETIEIKGTQVVHLLDSIRHSGSNRVRCVFNLKLNQMN